MLFNSIHFLIFFPIIFIIYWFGTKQSYQRQNFLLLIASYFFYACWDWRFLFLLVFSTVLDFVTGIQMSNAKNQSRRKFWFWLSIIINLGFLGVFKYFNFFAASFADAISNLGFHVNPWTISVILPVGISFYTFHGLSYVIDIYKNRIEVERNFIDYSVFVSFFPLLVAGPIERADHLLPQIKKKRIFDYGEAVLGLRQILWGLFKKVVIADQCAGYANTIFNNSDDYSGSTLVAGAIFFAFQIYGDFSGYSDIALGTARLLGIKLLKNFAFPYFSRDIAEFWRRWHISLSSWFKDYLYIPLGGSKGGMWTKIRNTFIIFIVSGFWHGANWTFIIWGFLNALYILPSIISSRNRAYIDIVAKGKLLPTLKDSFNIITTFMLTVIAWIFFRADNVQHAFSFVQDIFTKEIWSVPQLLPSRIVLLILFFVIIEWIGREGEFALESFLFKKSRLIRWLFYLFLTFLIFNYTLEDKPQFIYFQF